MDRVKESEKNMVKYEIYKTMYENLNKAIKYKYYYEAIFIEYAIIEDRLRAVLKYANVRYVDKNGREDKLSRKISKIKSRPEFATRFVKDRLSENLLDGIQDWANKRNALIHNLANVPYDSENVRLVAEEGRDIIKVFQSKSASVINRFKKEEK